MARMPLPFVGNRLRRGAGLTPAPRAGLLCHLATVGRWPEAAGGDRPSPGTKDPVHPDPQERGLPRQPPTRRRARRRLLISAGLVAFLLAATYLATGVTFGRFNATSPSQSDTFTAGRLTLNSTGTTGTCTSTTLVPNGSATTCSLQVSYAGNVPGWLGLDVLIATNPSAGGENLYNPGASDHPATFGIADTNSVSYALPTTALAACPSPGPYSSFNKCYKASNLLVSKSAFTSSSSAVIFTISITVPTNNASAYQGATAAVVIQAHAVQANNNGSTSACTAGATCPGITSWS
jgi:hypothetical protein